MNSLAAALRERRFCYVVELVASRLTREARLLDVASRLARLPFVRLDGHERLAVAGSQNHPWLPRQLRQLIGQIDPVAIRKPDVDEHRVGPRVPDDLERLRRIGCGRENLGSQGREEPGCKPYKSRVIIDDK